MVGIVPIVEGHAILPPVHRAGGFVVRQVPPCDVLARQPVTAVRGPQSALRLGRCAIRM